MRMVPVGMMGTLTYAILGTQLLPFANLIEERINHATHLANQLAPIPNPRTLHPQQTSPQISRFLFDHF